MYFTNAKYGNVELEGKLGGLSALTGYVMGKWGIGPTADMQCLEGNLIH